jgi:hypothetical protein
MAKLAVLISMPSTYTMHCPPPWRFLSELEPQGDVRSERRTPFSRARLSSNIGIKEPMRGQFCTLVTACMGGSVSVVEAVDG